MAGESGRALCVLGVLSLQWAQVFVGNRTGGPALHAEHLSRLCTARPVDGPGRAAPSDTLGRGLEHGRV